MVRLLIAIAAVIVVMAVIGVSMWAGRKLERGRKLADARLIDPALHTDLVAYVRSLTAVPDSLSDDLVILPAPMRDRGEELLRRVAEREAAKIRAERRRVGY